MNDGVARPVDDEAHVSPIARDMSHEARGADYGGTLASFVSGAINRYYYMVIRVQLSPSRHRRASEIAQRASS